MGRFIISRTAAGDRFLLQSDAGRTLAVSRYYATLDACKKGLCSLMYYAPTVPLADTTRGERLPNPKFEITGNEGAFMYAMKSANGKAVVTSGPFATKKACLRAVAMIRTGVVGAAVFFDRPGGLESVVVDAMLRDAGIAPAAAVAGQVEPAKQPLKDLVDPPAEDPKALAAGADVPDAPADHGEDEPMLAAPAVAAAASVQPVIPPVTKVPRRVHLVSGDAPRREAVKPPRAPVPISKSKKTTPNGILARLLKR